MAELEKKVSPKTRIIALSHVQFTSGYTADLQKLGSFCKERNIDLVIDGAQSVGCLPLYPEECNVAAVAVSSWKWLMGPFGAGLLYTSAEFRKKIEVTMVGSSSMQQGLEYLDHSWNPHVDGRKFEYSTLSWEHLAALNGLLDDVFYAILWKIFGWKSSVYMIFSFNTLTLIYSHHSFFPISIVPGFLQSFRRQMPRS